MNNRPALAYLVSRLPALSHTFILREILQLREQGWTVRAASINAPDRPRDALTAEESVEAETIFYVKASGVARAALAHLEAVFLTPTAWLRGIIESFRIGGANLRDILYHLFYFTEALLVRRWMREQGLTHLHVHFATPAASVALMLSRAYGTPFSITVHGPDEFYDARGYRLREKFVAARFIVCISDYARSQVLLQLPASMWNKVEVARLGVNTSVFHPSANALGNPSTDGALNLLSVGRLCEAKGQAILLEALAEALQCGAEIRLRLAGTGPLEAALKQRARELNIEHAVQFLGGVSPDRVPNLYHEADVFVMASFAEGLPVVLMEAMASGLPCISTAITGVPELISDEANGVLIPAGNSHALANALLRLHGDREQARMLGRNARATVLFRYRLADSVKRLEQIFARRLLSTGDATGLAGNQTDNAMPQATLNRPVGIAFSEIHHE